MSGMVPGEDMVLVVVVVLVAVFVLQRDCPHPSLPLRCASGNTRTASGAARARGGIRAPALPASSRCWVPRSPWPPLPSRRPPPRLSYSECPAECPSSFQHPPSSLPAAACPVGQIFVNCSDRHTDPELSRERTCEQQLLNLSVPARGPCLSGCACPQGCVPMSLWSPTLEGTRDHEVE